MSGTITISYREWKRVTSRGVLRGRSRELEAVDRALKKYERTKAEIDFVTLRTAFDDWIVSQQRRGQAWTNNPRNRTGIISRLHQEIIQMEAARSFRLLLDPEEMRARKALVEAERDALQTLFAGRRLVWKYGGPKHKVDQVMTSRIVPAAVLANAARGGYNQATGVTNAAVVPTDVSTYIENACAGLSPDVLFDMLGSSVDQVVRACTTIIAAASSPVKLLLDIKKLATNISDRSTVNTARPNFRQGQSQKALDAVVELIDVEIAKHALNATKDVASIVGNAFAMGPMAAAGTAVVDLLVNIKLYAQMAREMKSGNVLIESGNYSIELFNASPVLGCYFLLLADTSTWINFSAFDIGTPGWMTQVEKMAKKAKPVREKARELVRLSKYVVSGTEYMNGLEWEASWRNDKLEYLTQHANFDYIVNKLHHLVGAIRGKPHHKVHGARAQFGNIHPTVDPGRMYAINNENVGEYFGEAWQQANVSANMGGRGNFLGSARRPHGRPRR